MRTKINWDTSFYMMCLLSIFGGYYTEWLIYFATILIHECGHVIMATFMSWRLEEIKFFGFGGIMTYENELNQPLYQDLWISFGGVLANLIVAFILLYLPTQWLDIQGLRISELAIRAQIFTILLNLIPLPPLDGHRILLDLVCLQRPYRQALKLLSILNFVILISFIVVTFYFNVRQFTFIICYLIVKSIEFYQHQPYLLNRFLLQKKWNENTSLRTKETTLTSKKWESMMYRGVNNLMCWPTHRVSEQKLLQLKYKQN